MAKVEIYTGIMCGYCHMAKSLFAEKDVSFDEICVGFNGKERATMIQRANGRRTVPQIFINNRHIGGYAELYALESSGKLDQILET